MGTRTPHGRRWPAHRALLPACLLSIVLGCTFTFLTSTHAATRDSTKVLLTANQLERLIVDLETGQLRFVATGDPRSLHPWVTARAAYPGEAARLERLAAESSSAQAARAREIVRSTDAYLNEHAIPFVTTAQRNPKTARTLVARDEGRRRIDAIRGQFDRFTEVQHQILTAHERDAAPATRRMIAIAAGTSGSLFAVLLLVGLVTRTGVRRPGYPVLEGPAPDVPYDAGGQGALRRVATLAARGGPVDGVLSAVAYEMGRLLDAGHVDIGRFEPDATMSVLAHWSASDVPGRSPAGDLRPVEDGTAEAIVARTRRPARVSDDDPATGDIGGWARAHEVRRVIGCPILVKGRLWGVVLLMDGDPGPPAEGTVPSMTAFAELAGIAVAGAEARAGIAASRVRLVEASDAALHRIERNLHDRTQQRLVSVGLELRAAEAGLLPGQDALKSRLATVSRDIADIAENLRRIARDLHPAILSKGGLAASLRTLARRSPVPVLLDVHATGRLPDRVEVTVHRVVTEALANVDRHAQASVVHIDVNADDEIVRLSIRDDGVGGARPERGLARLRDRVEAVGGTMRVESPPRGGTTLYVTIPADPLP